VSNKGKIFLQAVIDICGIEKAKIHKPLNGYYSVFTFPINNNLEIRLWFDYAHVRLSVFDIEFNKLKKKGLPDSPLKSLYESKIEFEDPSFKETQYKLNWNDSDDLMSRLQSFSLIYKEKIKPAVDNCNDLDYIYNAYEMGFYTYGPYYGDRSLRLWFKARLHSPNYKFYRDYLLNVIATEENRSDTGWGEIDFHLSMIEKIESIYNSSKENKLCPKHPAILNESECYPTRGLFLKDRINGINRQIQEQQLFIKQVEVLDPIPPEYISQIGLGKNKIRDFEKSKEPFNRVIERLQKDPYLEATELYQYFKPMEEADRWIWAFNFSDRQRDAYLKTLENYPNST
jgi:hypothetical protein